MLTRSKWVSVYRVLDEVALRYALEDNVVNTGWMNDAMRLADGEYRVQGGEYGKAGQSVRAEMSEGY